MATQITLTLEGNSYDVLRCNYGFNRETDYRGRPTTGMLGGDIHLIIETTDDDFLWERLSGRKPRPVSGRLEITDTQGMLPIRTLEWYDAYIYAIGEGMVSISSLPMTQSLQITTRRLDINSHIRLDRRFPQTYGFWWEEYKEPEQVVVAAETVEEEEESTPSITSAAWQDEEKNLLTLIPHDLEQTVTLHIETTGFDNPGNDEEEVLIQIKDEEDKLLFDYTTRPGEKGEINLSLSIEEIISEKHDNPTEYLKLHPDLKLNLFASWLHAPDERKEATLEKEAHCTVKFRRDGTYHPKTAPDAYKGDFLFDWYREGDDDTPLSKWYNDPTMMDPASFNKFMNYNYQSFEEEWKKTHPTYKENYKYAIPAMTIVPGFTACLRLKLTVEKPVDKIDFRVTGGDEDTFSLNFNSFSIKNKNPHHFHAEKLQITCNKVFSQTMYLEARVGEQVVGKLEFIPNHEPYKMNISIIPVKITDLNQQEVELPKIDPTEITPMKELFQQLYIFPDIQILPPLDCKQPTYDYTFQDTKGKQKKIHCSLFAGTFLKTEGGKNISYRTDKYKIIDEDHIPKKLRRNTIFDYLNNMAKDTYNTEEIENFYKSSCKVFVFSLPANPPNVIGITLLKKTKKEIETWTDQVILFDTNRKNRVSPGTLVHEILHTFGLEHPWENEIYNGEYDWKFKRRELTDNIMDYVEGNDSTIEKRYRACSLWKWQYKMARELGKEQYKEQIKNHRYEEKYYK